MSIKEEEEEEEEEEAEEAACVVQSWTTTCSLSVREKVEVVVTRSRTTSRF